MSIISVRFFLIALFASILCALAAPILEDETTIAEHTLEKRSSGTGTWFTPGLGNCGGHNKSTDMIVALPTSDYANGKHCNKTIKITANGKTHTAKVVDSCPSCSEGDLDMSPSLFQEFTTLGQGEVKVSWSFE
ncbi:hypothetical protein FIBSPDRAFT_849503 [Athelia psychrophila]|uniref:Uncharacterized protein n=1 Tax=Athelia psychrophila TaxID=1759441 RepID=A0A166UC17_9AGAM|nr:hypothetical protein FIBSPDRAFT_849503 [Fibularhizoctonia sp. CBS 109695]